MSQKDSVVGTMDNNQVTRFASLQAVVSSRRTERPSLDHLENS